MMTDDEITEKWIRTAKEIGFSEAGVLNPETLKVMPLVRETCAEDKCHAYNHNWTCPPACGTLESCAEQMRQCKCGVLLQTVGTLEDSFDYTGMVELEQLHLQHFHDFAEKVRKLVPGALCLGTGGCRICKQCSYPEPCRFPHKACASMEGYGLVVSEVCRDNGLAYYYGPGTLAYVACCLVP